MMLRLRHHHYRRQRVLQLVLLQMLLPNLLLSCPPLLLLLLGPLMHALYHRGREATYHGLPLFPLLLVIRRSC